MWVTNRKSMKVNFATLCIGEKTILQIKNLLPVFLFPAETLWFGSSLAGYQWVSWCGRRVGDCLGAGGQLELGLYHWALLPPSPHRWFEFVWQVLSASQPAASQPLQIAEPKYDFLRQRFKARRLAPATISLFVPAVFKQELPLCNAGSAPEAPCAAPVGTQDGLWVFCSSASSVFQTPAWGVQCAAWFCTEVSIHTAKAILEANGMTIPFQFLIKKKRRT